MDSAFTIAVREVQGGLSRGDALRVVGDFAIELEGENDSNKKVDRLVALIGHSLAALAALTGSVELLGNAGELATLRSVAREVR